MNGFWLAGFYSWIYSSVLPALKCLMILATLKGNLEYNHKVVLKNKLGWKMENWNLCCCKSIIHPFLRKVIVLTTTMTTFQGLIELLDNLNPGSTEIISRVRVLASKFQELNSGVCERRLLKAVFSLCCMLHTSEATKTPPCSKDHWIMYTASFGARLLCTLKCLAASTPVNKLSRGCTREWILGSKYEKLFECYYKTSYIQASLGVTDSIYRNFFAPTFPRIREV